MTQLQLQCFCKLYVGYRNSCDEIRKTDLIINGDTLLSYPLYTLIYFSSNSTEQLNRKA